MIGNCVLQREGMVNDEMMLLLLLLPLVLAVGLVEKQLMLLAKPEAQQQHAQVKMVMVVETDVVIGSAAMAVRPAGCELFEETLGGAEAERKPVGVVVMEAMLLLVRSFLLQLLTASSEVHSQQRAMPKYPNFGCSHASSHQVRKQYT